MFAVALLAASEGRADAQCRGTGAGSRIAPVASEARRARWLIGDDAQLQANLDEERHRFNDAMHALDAERREIQVFATTSFTYQTVWPVVACTNLGSGEANFERMRAGVAVGMTHTATGLHARVSFVGALDQLNLSTSDDEDATNARTGSYQWLIAGRFGHDRWFRGLVGTVGADKPFDQVGTGEVQLARDGAARPAPGFFVGASLPFARTSVIALVQSGHTELVSVMARDLRPGNVPFAFSLGPTYIREERQTVGVLRLRSLGHEAFSIDREDTQAEQDGTVHRGASMSHTTFGPLLEMSAESRDARVRHGRFRVQADTFEVFGGETRRELVHGAIYGEATFFRSRFFSESAAAPGEGPRGTAWGFGGGLTGGFAVAPVFVSGDFYAGLNRPELLSLVPSAADLPELRAGVSLRFEN
ncbi:MAG: hypothetical protein JST00_37540 [Deltaproteobacteria bacterium]|nr:hypothetical protein [Deltaproteobacteria bacterium]